MKSSSYCDNEIETQRIFPASLWFIKTFLKHLRALLTSFKITKIGDSKELLLIFLGAV